MISGVISPVIDSAASVGINRIIEDGCYVIRYMPVEPSADVLFYEGTARVMRVASDGQRDPDNGEIRAGADLYGRLPNDPVLPEKDPDPAQWKKDPDTDGTSIPIFLRARYRYYLEVTKVMENVPVKGDVSISFSIHEFKQDIEWPNPGSRWVCLRMRPASAPANKKYFAGNVLDQDSGQIVGTLTMCRVSECLRRAKVSIHRVKGVNSLPGASVEEKDEKPQDAWTKAFHQAGWSLEVQENPEPDLIEPGAPDGFWSIGELQLALYAIRIRLMVDNRSIVKAERRCHKKLEQMTPVEIKEYIPDLSAYDDPLDKEWLYQLLCVQRIEGFDRGVMFDPYGSDSEHLPRDGAAVAAEWSFGPDAQPLPQNPPSLAQSDQSEDIDYRWGLGKGKPLQKVARAYFRVAVHEIGHAMGLDHNFKDYGFMNTTDSIACDELEKQEHALTSNIHGSQLATLKRNPRRTETESQILNDAMDLGLMPNHLEKIKPFPGFIKLGFQADDLDQLRFGSDISVRPGTTYHDAGPLSGGVAATPADGLELEVSPVLDAVPFGAPARIKLKLTNTSNQSQKIPNSLSLKTGVVAGSVVDPNGNERTFWPLKRAEDSDPGGVLAASETRTYTMTLLRGAQKALFPMAGSHHVKVTASWQRGANAVYLQNEASLRVTPPVDDNHRATALKVLSTPDTLLNLAIVGDQFTEGTKAIEAALGNPILKPHFAVLRAKLFLVGPIEVNPDKACDLIKESVVMSFDEIDSFSDLLQKTNESVSPPDPTRLKVAVQYLQAKIVTLRAQGEIEKDRADNVWNRLNKLINPVQQTTPNKPGYIPTR